MKKFLKLFFTLLFVLVMLVMVGVAMSCKPTNTLTGGQARHDNASLTVTYDGVTIHDTREVTSTTQPSATSSSPGKFRTTGGDENSIGTLDFSVDAIKSKSGSIAVAIMFLVLGGLLGAALWFTGNRISAIIISVFCFAGAGLAFMAPAVLLVAFILVMLAGGVYALWAFLHMKNQMVAGQSKALSVAAKIDPALPDILKTAIATEHDEATSTAVKQALPRQNLSDQVEVPATTLVSATTSSTSEKQSTVTSTT